MIGKVIAITAALAAPVPTTPAPINPPPIINAPCPDLLSESCLLGDTIYIDRHQFDGWGRDTAYGYRVIKLHEYGHVMDARRLTVEERAEFSSLINRSGLPWADPDSADIEGAGDYPQETFADDYARCRMSRAWPGFRPRVCRFMVRALSSLSPSPQ